MNKEVKEYYDKPMFGELLTITKTGIVNTCQILIDPRHDQLIHNGKLYYKWYSRLECGLSEHDGFLSDTEEQSIEIFNAVYYNGIQLVRKGKVHY